MARAPVVPAKSGPIDVPLIKIGETTMWVVGRTQYVFNSMSGRGRRELLYPSGGRRSRADRAGVLKHDPYAEFCDSITRAPEGSPTLLGIPAAAFHRLMQTAALDLPNTRKSEIGRMTWIVADEGAALPVWGVPEFEIIGVRTADLARTPDMRSHAVMREWCCEVTVQYVVPRLTASACFNLMFAGGWTVGVGDGRQEKGILNNGQFAVVPAIPPDAKEADRARIIASDPPTYSKFFDLQANAGREMQEAAMREPTFYNEQSRLDFEWFQEQLAARGNENLARQMGLDDLEGVGDDDVAVD